MVIRSFSAKNWQADTSQTQNLGLKNCDSQPHFMRQANKRHGIILISSKLFSAA
jgi:hypothetical protein